MATFKFRLASVLRVREHIKDQKNWELRTLHETRRQMVAELASLEADLAAADPAFAAGHIFTAIELQLRAEHGQSLAKRLTAKRVALAKFDNQLAEKRGELVEAMRAVKSLEQLRQRQEERDRRTQNLTEQKFGDEIASRKFAQPGSRKKNPR